MTISAISRIIGHPSTEKIVAYLTSPHPVMPTPRRVVVDWPQGVVRCEYDTRWQTMQLEDVLHEMAASEDMG